MNDELISVIVPIFNTEKYLEKCINSILCQTYKHLEIILIDDGSTDKSGFICNQYKIIDDRIKVVHQNNKGLSNARNKGLDIASGSLIGFVDSDDYIEPTMYEELKKNMDEYNSDISICNYCRIDMNGKKIVKTFDKTKFVSKSKDKFLNMQNEFDSLTVYAWNKLYKKKIFNHIRYPQGRIFEDSYVLCELLDSAESVSYLLKPLYNYIYRQDSIVNNFSLAHFDKIGSYNKKIKFFHLKGYYDLEIEEKRRKMKMLIINLSKMKWYNIHNKEVSIYYYKELKTINKEVPLKIATTNEKMYKYFGNIYVYFRTIAYYLSDFKHMLLG